MNGTDMYPASAAGSSPQEHTEIAPADLSDDNELLDRASKLIKLGAVCSEGIMSDPVRLRRWCGEVEQEPEIRAREAAARDMDNLQSRIITFMRENGKGNKVLEHEPIAVYLNHRFSTLMFNKTIFIYDGGIYRPNTGDLEERIREIITRADVKCSISREIREILTYMMTYGRCLEYPFNRYKNLIPVQNGIVRIDYPTGTAALFPHSPEFKFTYKLPVTFNEKADGQSFHENVISQYVDEEYIDTLYQIPAQALLQAQGEKPYKKSYVLQGDQDAGKTSYLEWLAAIFGPDNIAHASLHQIGGDKFINAVLEGKILNTYDDLSDVPLENIGPFKTLTGGFHHQVEHKHKEPYQSRITAVQVFTCNSPPDVPERILFDSAFWSRWEYLHFPNVFEVDPDFKERYFTPANLAGSFNRVIEMMIRIQREGLIINHTPSETKDEWQLSSDPFARFCRDHLVETSDEHDFNKDHLLASVQDYCRENEVNERKIPGSLKALTTMAFKNGFRDTMRGKKRVRFYATHRAWKPNSKYRLSKEAAPDAGNDSTLG